MLTSEVCSHLERFDAIPGPNDGQMSHSNDDSECQFNAVFTKVDVTLE